jgi:abhydrolase domain-containing protein 12
LRLNTSDGIGLGAWFVLSDAEYNFERTTAESTEASISAALRAHPTVLFFHGNAASRAVAYRVDHYKAWTSRMGANCLVIDYRGFGDSTGSPSEAGLAVDARTAWDWLLVNGARAQDVLVVGHSLGTAVASELVYRLETSGVQPKGLLLQAPFSSLPELVDTYYVFGFFPLMKPLEMLPGVKSTYGILTPGYACSRNSAAIKYFLAIQYDTQAIIAVRGLVASYDVHG